MGLLHALLGSLAGFVALCLAMERHHEEALGAPLAPRRRCWLRGLALLALAGSTLSVWPRPDAGIAWTEWGAQLTPAGLAVTALATWRPRWLPVVGGACAAAALLLGVAS